MPRPRLVSIDPAGVADLPISARLRSQLSYFFEAPDADGGPAPAGEYAVDVPALRSILDDGVLRLVSPLDTANSTEVELSEEQESLLEWACRHRVRRARYED